MQVKNHSTNLSEKHVPQFFLHNYNQEQTWGMKKKKNIEINAKIC